MVPARRRKTQSHDLCAQRYPPPAQTNCLHRIHSPSLWIHSGSFIPGRNACDWWDGAKFTAAGVIVVTINYRLDAEGWLPLPDALRTAACSTS
ncbi:MAG: carboxylesterase family protein [Lawsonella clevelandensis]